LIDNRDLISDLKARFEKAYSIAEKYGEIIGWVSRTSPSSISEEGGIVVFDVDPNVYFKDFAEIASAGSYLAVVDIKTSHIISLSVVSVERRDVLAELDLPEMYVSIPSREITGLLTRTRVKAKPLLSYDPSTDSVAVANYVIEPQSPVIKLKDPEIIKKILGLPSNGVFIGFVTIGDKPVFDVKAPLHIPLKTFYQHILVLGTTGSGKTTLLKNMIVSIMRMNMDQSISMLIMDPNRDYLTLPLKPTWNQGVLTSDVEVKMIDEAVNFTRRPGGLVIILPVTNFVMQSIGEQGLNWARALKMICEDYVKSMYYSIAERYGWDISINEIKVAEEPFKPPLRYVIVDLRIRYSSDQVEDYRLFIIPYGFRFTDLSPREFISLNPYFTRQARDAVSRLLNYLLSRSAVINTIYELYDILREARIRVYERRSQTKGVVLDPNRDYIIDLIKDLAVHKSTLENIIRQIGALIDTGLFDISIAGEKGEDRYLHEPPLHFIMENHFKIFNGYPIIVDLEYVQEHSLADPEKVISIVAFRVLNKVFEWKMIRSRQRIITQPVIILFDEAHRFFPSVGGGREEYIEHVSSMIDRIARLGRARRLGLVFSTHSPRDVHDIILQLTNTKIVLRMDKTQLSSLDIPSEYRELIMRATDRTGVVKSPVLRMGYVSFRTPLPLAGHYDLSALD